MKKINVILLSALLCAACSRDGIDNAAIEGISFTASLPSPSTRMDVVDDTGTGALNFIWNAGEDHIGIFAVGAGGSAAVNIQYTAASNGAVTAFGASDPGQTIKWNDNDNTCSFFAYYPYDEEAAALGAVPLEVPVEQDGLLMSLADNMFVWSATPDVSYGNDVELKFNHMLTAIEVRLDVSGFAAFSDIKITAGDGAAIAGFVGATVNLTDGTVSGIGAGSDKVIIDNGANPAEVIDSETSYYFAIYPGNLAGKTLTVTATVNGNEQTLATKKVPAGGLPAGVRAVIRADVSGSSTDVIDMNFMIRTTGIDMPANSSYGIGAYCDRNSQTCIQMNAAKKLSAYKSLTAGQSSVLDKDSDADIIQALGNDENFKFYAVYPYSADADFNAVEAVVPTTQTYSDGIAGSLVFTAYKTSATLISTAELEARTPFAVINLSVPVDIMEEGTPSTLKSIVITPAVATNFTGALAGQGTVDAETGVFSLGTENRSTSIKIALPEEGLTLTESITKIPVVALPFTSPAGGFLAEFESTDGNTQYAYFLNGISDTGTAVGAGTIIDVVLERFAPVEFPVLFPLGNFEGIQQFTTAKQPKWVSDALWTCTPQPQAYAQWTWVSTPDPGVSPLRETVNSGTISSPGIKGVWTGDYYEFFLPVSDFSANTQVKMEFPFYGRAAPVFWNVKYFDGGEWKTVDDTEKTFTIGDDSETRTCTFTLARDVIQSQSYTITFENGVKCGYLRFRIECEDGSVLASVDGSTPIIERLTRPWTSTPASTVYGAPFYFNTNAATPVKGISFSIAE